METLKNFWTRIKSENNVKINLSTDSYESTKIVVTLSWSGLAVVVGFILLLAIL